jgi:phosphate:Na+ symporter
MPAALRSNACQTRKKPLRGHEATRMEPDTNALMLKMAFSLIGGLGIFLMGMKNMSEGMQAIAGSRLRKLVGSVTNNRLSACGVGTLVTCMVQSSSVTTVMVVGFVTAGFMTLSQAIGVIMGANIGTTITGWILVLNIGKWGLPILGMSTFFYLFSRKDRVRYLGMCIMGIGMVFFGLELMSAAFKPMRTMPEFHAWFSRFSGDGVGGILTCALTGCILTGIVQSSSATLGIVMGLATTGVIDFRTATALVLGTNVGTTITAYLASIGQTTDAKRAAYSHILFNILGVLWVLVLFNPYLSFIKAIIGVDPNLVELTDGVEQLPHIRKGIAIFHSGFNIVNTIVMLPLATVLARVVTRLVPDKKRKEVPHLTYLDMRLIDAPAMSIQQSQVEVLQMGAHVRKMMGYLQELMVSGEPNDALARKLFHREEIMDGVQREVAEFLTHLMSGNIALEVSNAGRAQFRIADEYESISDYIAAILKLRLKLGEEGLQFSKEALEEITDLHKRVTKCVELVNTAVADSNPDLLSKTVTMGEEITHVMKDYRARHLDRVANQAISPLKSLIFTDMLTSYRKITGHCINIVEAVAGEK